MKNQLRSYTINVCSSDEAGNTASSFVCRLPEVINLPRDLYEIGLLDIDIRNKPEEVMLSDAPVTPLFPRLIEPDIVRLVFTVGETEQTRKIITQINDWAETNKVPIVLLMLMTEEIKLLIRLENNSTKNEIIILPEPLAKALGYRRRYFPPGVYWGETPMGNEDSSYVNKGETYIFARVEFKYTDNLIQVERLYPEKLYVAYRMQAYRSFMNVIVDALRKDGYLLEINIDSANKCEIILKSKSERLDEYVVLPEKLAQSLGFTETKFLVGTHVSPNPFNSEVFKTLKNEERLYFEFGLYDTIKVCMSEPTSLHYTDVLKELNEVFERWDFDEVRPVFSVVDGKLHVENLPENTFITLPRRVDDLFEIKEDTVFEKETEVEVGETIIDQEREVESAAKGADVILPGSEIESKRMLVLLDIVEYSYYRGLMLPLLREIDINSSIRKEFMPVIYSPLTSQHVQQFRVKIIDEYGREVALPNSETLLTLHLKPRI